MTLPIRNKIDENLNKVVKKVGPMNPPDVKIEFLLVLQGHLLLQADHILVDPCPLIGGEVLQCRGGLVDLVADLDHDGLGPHQPGVGVHQVGWSRVKYILENKNKESERNKGRVQKK